jgi:hypothetical protein
MANHVYPKYKKASMSGGANVNLLTGSVKVVLIDEGTYTYDAAHEFLSDIPSGAQLAISGALTSKSVGDDGAFHSANGRFDPLTSVSAEALALFVDSGTPSTSRLVMFQDTDVVGLPVTPAGAAYNVIVDPTGWFIM